jgi:hypothetical protein
MRWWNPLAWRTWLNNILAQVANRRSNAVFPSFRPHLEPLEVRIVPSLAVTGSAFAAAAGNVYSGTIAQFSDSHSGDSPSATIYWGRWPGQQRGARIRRRRQLGGRGQPYLCRAGAVCIRGLRQ